MMKTLLLWLLLSAGVLAQEGIALTVPVVPVTPPTLSSYTPGSLLVQRLPRPYIQVVLVGTNDAHETFEYPCETPCAMDTEDKVLTMIQALNTADLKTRSLFRRVLDRLVLDFPGRFPPGGVTVQ